MQKLIIKDNKKTLVDLTPEEIAEQQQRAQAAQEREQVKQTEQQAAKDAYNRLKENPSTQVQDMLIILRFLYRSIED